MLEHEEITGQIIGAAIKVHRELGPGLLESAYEVCLCDELERRGLVISCQVDLPVEFKGRVLTCGYRMDVVVENLVVVEVKAVERLMPIHEAQLLTYLRLSRKPVGMLMNFNVPVMRDGIKRLALTRSPVLSPSSPSASSASPR